MTSDAENTEQSNQMVVVAIDGPAGSGKSTVAKMLAERVQLPYLDTGAMYRAVTFACIAADIDPEDAAEAAELARQMDLRMDPDGGITVNGLDATTQIRGPAVTRAVSSVASHKEVRAELVSRQREWARRRGGGVLEGRDIGTVVFPDAILIVYLTASPEVRAARRAGEVADLDYDTVAADIARRDALDQNREVDPLRRADGALELDTTYLTIEEVLDVLENRLNQALEQETDRT